MSVMEKCQAACKQGTAGPHLQAGHQSRLLVTYNVAQLHRASNK
jgi:hypothetical protein